MTVRPGNDGVPRWSVLPAPRPFKESRSEISKKEKRTPSRTRASHVRNADNREKKTSSRGFVAPALVEHSPIAMDESHEALFVPESRLPYQRSVAENPLRHSRPASGAVTLSLPLSLSQPDKPEERERDRERRHGERKSSEWKRT